MKKVSGNSRFYATSSDPDPPLLPKYARIGEIFHEPNVSPFGCDKILSIGLDQFYHWKESSDYSLSVHPNTKSNTKNTPKRYDMKKSTKPTTPGQQKPDPHVDKADGESAVLAMIASMPEADRVIGERLHEIIKSSAPVLSPRLWYGMPAYARDGKVVCFFQSREKFRTRYATFGFMHEAHLDEGNMWPTAFALKKVTAAEEEKIAALVKKAAG
jgi:hypothetical protein